MVAGRPGENRIILLGALTANELFTMFTLMNERDELRHCLLDLMDGNNILSGAVAGRRLLSALIADTPSARRPDPFVP